LRTPRSGLPSSSSHVRVGVGGLRKIIELPANRQVSDPYLCRSLIHINERLTHR